MGEKIKVTVWGEFRHEKSNEAVKKLYPDGMHATIAKGLKAAGDIEVRTATLDEPEHGLTEAVLDSTDVLTWWGHAAHGEVADKIVERVKARVLTGMGLIVLHSGHYSKIFRSLMGTNCSLKWREAAEKERLWNIEPGHPITQGIGEYIELPNAEMYGERFDIPTPDKLVFISWFEGGEVFRSGCCWERGNGRIFYFRPGHETYPIFHNPQIIKVITNAVRWAKPRVMLATDKAPHVEAIEKIAPKKVDFGKAGIQQTQAPVCLPVGLSDARQAGHGRAPCRQRGRRRHGSDMAPGARRYNGPWAGEHLNHVAFPLGGIGAGMVCLEGTGALSHVSLRHRPEVLNEPLVFSALCVKGEPNVARVIEGPVPGWKVFFPWGKGQGGAGNGCGGKSYGLPRFAHAEFSARFPFGRVDLADPKVPLVVEVTGWSPFVPGDADASSLPAAALEYRLANRSGHPVEAVWSFHATNFMATGSGGQEVRPSAAGDGFVLWQPPSEDKPWDCGAFLAAADDAAVRVDCAWFRGGWFDPLTMVWKAIARGEAVPGGGRARQAPSFADGGPSPGGSLYVPIGLRPGEARTIRLRLAWHVPVSDLRIGKDPDDGCVGGECCRARPGSRETYVPWYAGRFADVEAVDRHWRERCDDLRERSLAFADCFQDTTLPDEVVEAVAANLTILKSPTVLRQADGRLWAWEGCCDEAGCCHGSCTHVWNYAQALPHLFPELERSLRQTEFGECQDERGHQNFRAYLPIRPADHGFHAAADGQLGGIMKVHRDWRIGGVSADAQAGAAAWLGAMWPSVRRSLDYCIETWDPDGEGVVKEPHHNTYDIEFWGPDGMCTSFYLGALGAAAAMGRALGEDVARYEALREKGRAFAERELFNGEYFVQRVEWTDLRAPSPLEQAGKDLPPEAFEIVRREGPKYQYGTGCLADGVLGEWMAACCGLAPALDPAKVESHLLSVFRHNFREDPSEHANPQRPGFALGDEGGLLLCTWPRGGEPSLPFPYSNEVWTGFEYQVASHLAMTGHVAEALRIVRAARDRYDGRVRNPFDEYECGHWYARAMSSYALIQGLAGVRYDAVEKTLHVAPRIEGDFRSFLSTASGFGTVGVRDGRPFVEARHGTIEVERIDYRPWIAPAARGPSPQEPTRPARGEVKGSA